MYVRQAIGVKDILWDSWRILVFAGVWAIVIDFVHDLLGYRAFALPVLPVTTIGIVISFYLGFKSTSAYNRWWEARQTWGDIINKSRTWANHARNLVDTGERVDRTVVDHLVLRHLAWVNALAFQMRKTSRLKVSPHQHIFDYRLADETLMSTSTPACFESYLSDQEVQDVTAFANPAFHILRRQGDYLQELYQQGILDNNRLVEMMRVLGELYDCQGKCERIKNTPFPRQFSYFGRVFTWIFIVLLPMAFISSFEDMANRIRLSGAESHEYIFLLVPFTMLISWVFYILEKVSDSCENPFEGGTTDVPVSALTRIIEIDLLQSIDASEVPAAAQPKNGVLY